VVVSEREGVSPVHGICGRTEGATSARLFLYAVRLTFANFKFNGFGVVSISGFVAGYGMRIT